MICKLYSVIQSPGFSRSHGVFFFLIQVGVDASEGQFGELRFVFADHHSSCWCYVDMLKCEQLRA